MDRSFKEIEFHHVFDRITDAYVALDNDWRYTFLNAKACDFFGRPATDLIGRRIWDEFPDAVGHPFQHACEKAMAEQRSVTLEAFYAPYQRWFENRIHPSPDGLTIYFVDITERKQIEQELEHNQRMLAEAQHVARVGNWEWDIVANKVTWSAELYRIYGLEPSQYAATFEAYLALVHPLDRERVRGIIDGAYKDHQPFGFDEHIVRADGTVRTLRSTGVVDLDAEGNPMRMLGACHDITARRRAERLESGQHDILEGIAARRPLAESLERIARLRPIPGPATR